MLRELVERAIRVKVDVVVDDLKETGGADGHPGREVLNYGHTLAHAIERASDYAVRHGEAVAIGCVYVAELAAPGRLARRRRRRAAPRRRSRRVGLPTTYDGASFDDLHAAMKVDKKARGSQLRFVVLDDLAAPADPRRARRGRPARRRTPRSEDDVVTKVLVLNGPNLGRLGRRQPEIYGTTTHAELADLCVEWGRELGLEVEVRQTNHEGELLDWLNAAADDGLPGGAQRRRVDALLATRSATPAPS